MVKVVPGGRGIIDSDGDFHPGVIPRVHQVAVPASVGSLNAVDLSSDYSSIIAVIPLRLMVANGDPYQTLIPIVGENATNPYADGKFVYSLLTNQSHGHSYDKADSPTGPDEPGGDTVGAGHVHFLTYTSTTSGLSAPDHIGFAGVQSGRTLEVIVYGVPA